MEARKEYCRLLELGELLDMFPGLEGVWEQDKKAFTEMYNLNQELDDNSDFFDMEEDY